MAQPTLIVTAEDLTFDKKTLQNWGEEGFDVVYLPLNKSREEYIQNLNHISDSQRLGDKVAVVGLLALPLKSPLLAFGEAAGVVLDESHKILWNLCALVAYYPDTIPRPAAGWPSDYNVTIHVTRPNDTTPNCRQYMYADVQPGFAEQKLDVYDKASAGLAWSRTLAVLRKGFEIEVDLEKVWDDHAALEFVSKDADATMATMVAEPYVNHIPTLTGGIGYKDLHRFYRDYFIPGNPPSLRMKILSRTVGTDRIVDELYLCFKHTQIMPWMLPDVEPTNKEVEIALVAIVCIRGGKLYHEHIYWDQASVLVQIGLLEPYLIPGGAKGRLPVVDRAGARKVADESSVRSNELISSW